MAKKKTIRKSVGKIESRKVFSGNKGYERMVVTKTTGVGRLNETYYDLRVFRAKEDEGEEEIFPTPKGISMTERSIKQVCLYLIKDLFSDKH